jgi:CubicO group peptidase (beta-lactamase class C family)
MLCFAAVADLLGDAVSRRIFPCATIEVGGRDEVYWRHACGTLSYDEAPPPATLDTVFDLASLTKVLATTTVLMQAVDQGTLQLDDTLGRCFEEWRGEDRSAVTVADLLEHASGLTSHLPFFRDHRGRDEFQHAICSLPLEYLPRSQSLYSDLGFVLLGFLVADAAGSHGVPIPIDAQFDQVARRLNLGDLCYRPPAAWRPRTAPTEVDPWRGRLLQGEVHDENGWALGGVAGHTGLFGTAPAVGRFARAVLETLAGATRLARPATLARFLRHSTVPASSRALGWDTMLATSSCGHRLSSEAIGHTGFTGTSLWIDPSQDLYIVLLTNRVHPTRDNDAILEVRPAVHDAVVDALLS